MRVLGIDPGSRIAGFGVVERRGAAICHLGSGTIVLPPGPPGPRLARLHAACRELVVRWSPATVVVERAFVARNVQSALRLGEARGAVLAAIAAEGVDLCEYTPAEVKLAAVGHGAADKQAMRGGIAAQLGIAVEELATDAADALAVALCHLWRAPLARRVAVALGREKP